MAKDEDGNPTDEPPQGREEPQEIRRQSDRPTESGQTQVGGTWAEGMADYVDVLEMGG